MLTHRRKRVLQNAAMQNATKVLFCYTLATRQNIHTAKFFYLNKIYHTCYGTYGNNADFGTVRAYTVSSRGGKRWPALASEADPKTFRVASPLETFSFCAHGFVHPRPSSDDILIKSPAFSQKKSGLLYAPHPVSPSPIEGSLLGTTENF